MPLWDIIGPVMIGPSSSHTAGAVRLGRIVRGCWGDEIKKIDIYLRGSFATTGAGHGTDKALLAGLLGCAPDDPAIREAYKLADEAGLDFRFIEEDVDGAHPNSARFVVYGGDRKMEVVGASVGGGAVCLQELDGFTVDLSGTLPSIIILNKDVKGVVSAVTSFLSEQGINIATMALHRDTRGGLATMVLELDTNRAMPGSAEIIGAHPAIVRVIALPGEVVA